MVGLEEGNKVIISKEGDGYRFDCVMEIIRVEEYADEMELFGNNDSTIIVDKNNLSFDPEMEEYYIGDLVITLV